MKRITIATAIALLFSANAMAATEITAHQAAERQSIGFVSLTQEVVSPDDAMRRHKSTRLPINAVPQLTGLLRYMSQAVPRLSTSAQSFIANRKCSAREPSRTKRRSISNSHALPPPSGAFYSESWKKAAVAFNAPGVMRWRTSASVR